MILVLKKNALLIFLVALLTGYGISTYWSNQASPVMTIPTARKIVFLDAGHGGNDPGKVSIDGTLEKTINLQIAKKLQQYLEQSGTMVYMTRVEDEGLYLDTDTNKKRADLSKRKDLVKNSEAQVFISIHQNSFTQSKYNGAQVFYQKDSKEGEELAKLIQEQFKICLDDKNNRQAKVSENYYLLKKTNVPSVIVECGFLSNEEEAKNLVSNEYQQKVAWSIYVALVQYFTGLDK